MRFPAQLPADITVTEIDLDHEEVTLPDGRRLTPALAEQLATHAERGAGRPSLAQGTSPHISFRVPQAEKDRLARYAAQHGRRPSDVAREAFGRGLDLVGA